MARTFAQPGVRGSTFCTKSLRTLRFIIVDESINDIGQSRQRVTGLRIRERTSACGLRLRGQSLSHVGVYPNDIFLHRVAEAVRATAG